MTSVSSVPRILARSAMAEEIDAGIRLTPPYGKSAIDGQMRHAIAAMRGGGCTMPAHAPAAIAERRLNGSTDRATSAPQIFLPERSSDALSQAVVALGWQVQMTTPWRPGMTIQAKILGAIAVSGLAALAMTSQAQALTAQECSAKYQAAKTAGTLGDQKWNDFRKAQCGADATPAAAAAAPAAARPRAKEAQEGSRQEGSGRGGTVRPRGLSERGRSEIFQGERQARRACTPASTSTTPTRPAMPMAA